MAQASLSLRARLDVALATIRGRDGYEEASCAAMGFALDLAERLIPGRRPASLVAACAADLAVEAARRCVESRFARTAASEAERVAALLLSGPRAQAWLHPLVNANDPLGAARAALALAVGAGLVAAATDGILALETRGQ